MAAYPTPPGDPAVNTVAPRQRWIAVELPLATPRLVYVLLAIIVLVSLYFFSLPESGQAQFLYDWAKVNELIRDGEYYRMFTSMFLHLTLMHLFFNGYALYLLGRDVESLFGTARFAVIYFLGGLTGSLASFLFSDAPSVGASGAIFAIFGAEIVYFYRHRALHGEAGRRHLSQLIMLMVFNLALGLFSSAGVASFRIDNAAHLGGLAGGALLAWLIGPIYRIKADYQAAAGFSVTDTNAFQRWSLLALVYAASFVVVATYAVLG